MPYLGKSPQHGNYSKLDDFSGDFDGSDATHAIASNGTAITPVRPEALIISINGVIQEPVTDYTVSGTNITFTTAPTAGDNFFGVAMGEQLQIGTPSDGTITSAKLSSAVLTGHTDIGGAIADADLFLVDDGAGGTLRKTAASRLKTYAGTTIANNTDNYVTTATGTGLNGEANLTFDGNALVVKGTSPSVTIGDAGTEDTKLVFDGNAQDYYIGLDDTDDDFKIGLGSAVGTTAHMVFDETGAITTPLNPAFKATGSSVSNVTGDGTVYQIIFNTEVFDANGDHSNGVFTAPVSGNYFFHTTVFCMQIDSTHTTAQLSFVTSDGSGDDVRPVYINIGAVETSDSYFMCAGAANIYLTASQTCVVQLGVYSGSKIIDLDGGYNMSFGGFLVG